MSRFGKHTAEGVALGRALEAHAADPLARNPDVLAERLLRPLSRLGLLPGVRELTRIALEVVMPGIALFLLARTRAFDDFLLRELAADPAARPAQVVVLGAGLDSRPYRFREQLRGVAVFEVDLPATARWKKERLEREAIDARHVTFVGVDFAHERLDERLRESGWRADARTVWLWEGVMYYLHESAVKETLRVLGGCAPGSSVLFDFFLEEAYANPKGHRGAAGVLAMLKVGDEPIRFTIAAGGLPALLSPFGLAVESIEGPQALQRRWLAGLGGRIGEVYGIAAARRLQPRG